MSLLCRHCEKGIGFAECYPSSYIEWEEMYVRIPIIGYGFGYLEDWELDQTQGFVNVHSNWDEPDYESMTTDGMAYFSCAWCGCEETNLSDLVYPALCKVEDGSKVRVLSWKEFKEMFDNGIPADPETQVPVPDDYVFVDEEVEASEFLAQFTTEEV